MSPEEIKEAQKICDLATPGPWKDLDCDVRSFYPNHHHRMAYASTKENAAFIAFARTALPKALAALEAAQEDNEMLKKLTGWKSMISDKELLSKLRAAEEELKDALEAASIHADEHRKARAEIAALRSVVSITFLSRLSIDVINSNKPCSCCGKYMRDVKFEFVGIDEWGIYINCECNSTLLFRSENAKSNN